MFFSSFFKGDITVSNESSSSRTLYRDSYTLGHGATAAVLGKVGTWILEEVLKRLGKGREIDEMS